MLVVIGSNGFIGRHLTAEAARRGVSLTLVSPSFDRAFLEAHAPGSATITALELESGRHDDILRDATAVAYLAGTSVPGTSANRPVGELTQNVQPAFSTFLRLSSLNPNALLVYLSSGGTVYGHTTAASIPETHDLRPISPYGLGKRLSEECLVYCGTTVGQRFAILRVSNVVGRWHRNPDQGLVMKAIRAIRADVPLQIFGDGSSVRDYLDADDLADAILRVAASPTRASIWNVGSGTGHTTLEVVDIVARALGREPRIEFVPSRGIDVERCVLSTERIRSEIGWSPTTSLEESVRKVVEATAP